MDRQPRDMTNVARHLEVLQSNWGLLHINVEAPGRFPAWDAILLTASSERQARLHTQRLETCRRFGLIPPGSLTRVVADPPGGRIGSGGATLHALADLVRARPDIDWAQRRVLLIHAGGESRRIPWANLPGKPFIPFPLLASAGRPAPSVFDHLLAVTASLAACLPRGGLVTLCGDVLPLFPSAHLSFPARGAVVVTTPAAPDMARRHGVIVSDPTNRVIDLLQKVSLEQLVGAGAIDQGGSILLDTGIHAFFGLAFEGLLRLACQPPDPVDEILGSRRECSLYEQVAAAMVPAKHQWLRGEPLGERLLEHLGSVTLFHEKIEGMDFIHLGSTSEVLNHLGFAWDGKMSRRVLAETGRAVADSASVYLSRLAPGAHVGSNSLILASRLGDGARVGNRCVVMGLDDGGEDLHLPDHCCLWQLPLDAKAGGPAVNVLVCCGVDDDPKSPLPEATFCNRNFGDWLARQGIPLDAVWRPGEERTLWNARLYPARPALAACSVVGWMWGDRGRDEAMSRRWLSSCRYSMADLNVSADVDAFLGRQDALTSEMVLQALRRTVQGSLDHDTYAFISQLESAGPKVNVADLFDRADPSGSSRGRPMPDSRRLQIQADLLRAEGSHAEADRIERQVYTAIELEVVRSLRTHTPAVVRDIPPGEHSESRLPVRFDLAGGWSDTPPYCLERPARVVNLAMTLDGALPIGARAEAIPGRVWEFNVLDRHRCITVREPGEASSTGGLDDPFILSRTALLLTGYGTNDRITQGVRVTTWSDIPQGSGLGASSILAAALIRALQRLAGRPDDAQTVSELVLVLEQRMSTGGGWQDQIGGLIPGVKCIDSQPTIPLQLTIETVPLIPRVGEEFAARFVVAFTGKQRLAKNILRTVVGGYLRRDARALSALGRVVDLAGEARQALGLGRLDDLGSILREAWLANQQLVPHCSNPSVEALLDGVRPWSCGAKLAGAGGGGFLGIIAKDAEAARHIRRYLDGLGNGVQVYRWRLWEGGDARDTESEYPRTLAGH
jgi:fucokinase